MDVVSICGLIIEDSSCTSDPYGGLVVATENVSDIIFCYNKRDILDAISNYSLELDPQKIVEYEQKVKASRLPEFNYKDIILIDGTAAENLAWSYQAYLIACRKPYAPGSAWPWLDNLPKASIGSLFSNQKLEDLDYPEEIELFNILFAVCDGFQSTVHVINSREQYDDLMHEFAKIPLRNGADLNKMFGGALLPEVSDIPPVTIVGGVAEFIYPVVVYVNYIQRKIREFGSLAEQRKIVAANLN